MLRHSSTCRIVLVAFAFCLNATAGELPKIDSAGLNEGDYFSPILSIDREELLNYRQQKVEALRHLGLYPQDYVSTTEIFSGAVDQQPSTKSSGFYLANPHLLIIPSRPGSVLPITYLAPKGNPAHEQTMQHNEQQMRIVYRHVSANHWLYWVHGSGEKIRLWGINARDAGFTHAMLDVEKSRNINISTSGNVVRQPTILKSFFHYGANVSANNLSPAYPDMVVSLDDIYAEETHIYIKLWRGEPESPTQAEDYAYIIQVFPDPDAADYDDLAAKQNFYDAPELDVYDVIINEIFLDFRPNLTLFVALLIAGYLFGKMLEHRHYRSIHRREKELLHIPTTTTWHYDTTREIARVQFAHGGVAVSTDFYKRAIAFFRGLIGGEIKTYSPPLDRAKREALLRMKESCPDCDIYVNCRFQTSAIKHGRRVSCVEIIAYATAIRYKK
ncbi:MAG: heavy metal-binding domain-containing protein [Proteobacteria bacterium]|nr:heavy metal-binding domain-containing protein [Pseudomonadota bacterium]